MSLYRKTLFTLLVLSVGLLFLNSCKDNDTKAKQKGIPAEVVPSLHQNNLSKAVNPSSFLLSQADSPIHWQPWNKEVFENAAKEQKTVFVFIGQFSNYQSVEILKQLNSSPATYELLNKSHANILVDADQHPDLNFFLGSLNLSFGRRSLNTMIAWFSPEGNPVSSISLRHNPKVDSSKLITQMSNTVNTLWREDPDYVLKNSSDDLARRLNAFTPLPAEDNEPLASFRATRQASSLYDPTTGHIDNLSRLSVSRYIRLLSLASSHPDVSGQQRKKYIDTATRVADKFLLKDLLDPLDGGIFPRAKRPRGTLPIFTKSLSTQTQALEALYTLYSFTSDKKYLTTAQRISNYIEKTLTLSDGSYSLGNAYNSSGMPNSPCMWTLKEIQTVLSQEETNLCIQAFGISPNGNIPRKDSLGYDYTGKNILIWQQPLEKLAEENGLSSDALQTQISTITEKLATAREKKGIQLETNKLSTIDTTAALASAYIMAYRVDGKIQNLEKAKTALNFIRNKFISENGTLQRCRYDGQLLTIPARGIDYANLCRASLDMHEATLDPLWLEWAEQIHTEMNTALNNNELTDLVDTNDNTYPRSYKTRSFVSISLLNNESLWAVAYANASRLYQKLGNTKNSIQAAYLKSCITNSVHKAPMEHIDFLIVDNMLQQKTVYLKASAPSELLLASLSSPCQIVSVTDPSLHPELAKSAVEIGAGQAIVTQGGKPLGTANNPDELKALLR